MIEGLATETAVQSIRVMKKPTSIAHSARQGCVLGVLMSLTRRACPDLHLPPLARPDASPAPATVLGTSVADVSRHCWHREPIFGWVSAFDASRDASRDDGPQCVAISRI